MGLLIDKNPIPPWEWRRGGRGYYCTFDYYEQEIEDRGRAKPKKKAWGVKEGDDDE